MDINSFKGLSQEKPSTAQGPKRPAIAPETLGAGARCFQWENAPAIQLLSNRAFRLLIGVTAHFDLHQMRSFATVRIPCREPQG